MSVTDLYVVADPLAELDYSVDWSDWLADGETISAATWSVAPAGELTIMGAPHAPAHTGTVATVWLTGGIPGVQYRVENRITTSDTRKDHRSIYVMVRDR